MCGVRGNPGIVLLCAVVLCSAAVRARNLRASSPDRDHDGTFTATSEGVMSDRFIAGSYDPPVHDIVINGTAAEIRPSARPRDHDYPSYIPEAFSFDPTTWTQSPPAWPAGEQLLVDMILSPSTPDNTVGLRSDAALSSGSTAFDPLETTDVSAVVPVVGAVVLGMIWIGLVGWLHRRRGY